MVQISAVIITFNEERNIERCLKSLQGVADEIVVVDSFSNDSTKAICETYQARILEHPFSSYGQQKNYATEQASFRYVLSLDADESLSSALQQAILQVKQNWSADGYFMNRLTNYCGKWMHHVWYPDAKLRLWDKAKGGWNDSIVHEKVELKPGSKTHRLKGDLLHFSFYSLEGYIDQQKKYAVMSARALFSHGRRCSRINLIFNPLLNFIKLYFFKGGFLDGYEGYLIARVSAFTVFLKYSLLREMQNSRVNRL
jgi:glycosyltransferase involved in cell wall biosynthesis